mmetsp:Transcript_55081/g.125309  ORF Transcript_55081/g.125309 Transcript_55081/m.125309 type:complete len:312 (+) Transcript_55081:149-1084(+)
MFAKAKSLPPSTFHEHVADYKESRAPLPSVPDRAAAAKAAAKRRRRGKPALISYEKQEFIIEVIVRADRANEGMTSLALFDMIEALCPELKRKQIRPAFIKFKRSKRNRGRLTGTVKAQKSTTKRSAITVEQQFRWHQCIEGVFREMRLKYQGVCPKTGKTFGMEHFVIGGDETCLLASDGNVMIIGDSAKRKHEKADAGIYSWISHLCALPGFGEMYFRWQGFHYHVPRGGCGWLHRADGLPPPGIRRKVGFNAAFFRKHGAAEGPGIYMTPTGYMTEEAWVAMAEDQAKGIRAMPYICDNPDWWVVKNH